MQEEKSLIDQIDYVRNLLFQYSKFEELSQPAPQELIEQLKALVNGAEVDKCVQFIRSAEAQIDFLDREIDHIELQKKKFKNAIDALKNLAQVVMETYDIKKIEGEKGHAFTLRQNEHVNVTDLTKIPAKFTRQKISIEPDKVAIKAMIKLGETIEGAELVTDYSVVVK